jgi:hypothetical protein
MGCGKPDNQLVENTKKVSSVRSGNAGRGAGESNYTIDFTRNQQLTTTRRPNKPNVPESLSLIAI